MRWPKYWSFSFSIIPSKEIPGLISFRLDWLGLLAVQGTLESLLVIFGDAESSLLLVGYSVIKVLQFLSAVASLVVEHRLQGMWASVAAAHQALLSITNSQSLLKCMSIKSVMASSHHHPLVSPSPPAPNPSQHQSLFQ